MKAQWNFIVVGPDGARVLYRTEDPSWANRLGAFIEADWEGRKSEYGEGLRNTREVVVTKFDEPEFVRATARANARQAGIAPKPVVAGQRFATLSALAEHLGVTVAAVGKALKTAGKESARVRGASFQYLEDYVAASSANVKD